MNRDANIAAFVDELVDAGLTPAQAEASVAVMAKVAAPKGPWLTAEQAAAYCGISDNALRALREEWLAAHPGNPIEKRIGRRAVRFSQHDLDRLIAWAGSKRGR